MGYSPWGHKESDMTERVAHRVVPYIFWICLFLFFENDINILIGIAVKLYLALGTVEMSTILSLQSMSVPITCALFQSFSTVYGF